MKIDKENDSVGAVLLIGNETQRPLKPTDDNTDALLQPPWTDDKHRVSVQSTSMIGMITEKRRRLWKSLPPWLAEEADLKDASDPFLDRPSTDTPVSDRTELVVTFLLVDRMTRILSNLIHPHSLLSMPSIVSHRIHTKTPVLKLMCPLRPVTPLRK